MLATAASPGPSSSPTTPSCPPGARLATHNGNPKCAWESDLRGAPASDSRGTRTFNPDLWLCFIAGGILIYDYYVYQVVFCINLTELFEPCGTCADGKQCQISNGQAECVHVCGADEVGGGQEPCQTCGDGEVANDGGTDCVACEHGESSAGGTCNSDPCDGVYCPVNAHCDGGQCQCDAGYKPTHRLTGGPAEPELVLECVPDPCYGVVCGKNSVCSNGQCQCSSGYEDPDADGDCTRVCTQGAYDTLAKSSLLSIPREPWEQGEWYSCSNGTVTVERPRRTIASKYLYTDFPTNSQRNVNKGNVCALDLGVSLGGGGHSHPHFVWERDRGVRCGSNSSDTIRSRMDVDDFNAGNVNFSTNDKRKARAANGGAGRPLYLVVPERNCVKVYRKNASGRWGQSGCL